MARWWTWLALIVVLSSAPFRLAEAANDLSRSMAGPEDLGEFELIDGGVGDDPVEAVRDDPGRDQDDRACEALPAIDFASELAPARLCLSPARGLAVRPPDPRVRRPLRLERLLC